MNRQQTRMLIAVCFAMVVGSVFGPRIGDLIDARFDPHPFWQVLPWLLIAAIWVVLWRLVKRAPPQS